MDRGESTASFFNVRKALKSKRCKRPARERNISAEIPVMGEYIGVVRKTDRTRGVLRKCRPENCVRNRKYHGGTANPCEQIQATVNMGINKNVKVF